MEIKWRLFTVGVCETWSQGILHGTFSFLSSPFLSSLSFPFLSFPFLSFPFLSFNTLCLLYPRHHAEDSSGLNPYNGSILQVRKLIPGSQVQSTCGMGRCIPESWLSSPLNSASPTDSSFTVSPLDAENHACVVLHVTNPTGRGMSYILPQWSPSLELCNHFGVMELGFGVLGEHGGSWGTTGSQTFCLWILDFRTLCQSPHKLCLLRPRCS